TIQQAYAAFPHGREHWLLTLQRAGHMSFMNRCIPGGLIGNSCADGMPEDEAHTTINRWATAFLLHWVAGDARYAAYLDRQQPTADLQVARSA
ncbi:MAG: hypothetical protein JO247_17085, partial [Chloroflexi bacterium]|nr:hypothetical protein [Chloroflexota bacterium]